MPVSPVDQLTWAAIGTTFDKTIAGVNLRQVAAILPSLVENPLEGAGVAMMRTTGRGMWSAGKFDHPARASVGGLIGLGLGAPALPPALPQATSVRAATAATAGQSLMAYPTVATRAR